MFGWLVKMLMKTPVGPSGCACCEGHRRRLEEMRKEIVGENIDEEIEKDSDAPDDGQTIHHL